MRWPLAHGTAIEVKAPTALQLVGVAGGAGSRGMVGLEKNDGIGLVLLGKS